MNKQYYAIHLFAVLLFAVSGCKTLTSDAMFKAERYRSATSDKARVADAWLEDITTHGGAVVSFEAHPLYSRAELQDVLPRLKNDIKQQMTVLVSSRGSTPVILDLDGETEKGFAAKYDRVLLAFALIDSQYILVDIDPVKRRNP